MAPIQFNTRTKSGLNSILLMVVLASLFFNPTPVLADDNLDVILPDLSSFSLSLLNGEAGELRGVYAPQVMALPVIQQPVGNPGYVSTMEDILTQFSMATEVGNVGLLAHNNLAGQNFSNFTLGQEITLIYGDGSTETFVVSNIIRYQALNPYSPYSEFRDLETTITITAQELFQQVYRGDRHVTFQTCIESEGNLSWGRLFVIAEPKAIVEANYYMHVNMIVK
jgi:hypothetical protein